MRHLKIIVCTVFGLLVLSAGAAYFIYTAATPMRQLMYQDDQKGDRPIEFYARFIDERKQPVQGARVTIVLQKPDWRFRFGVGERIIKDVFTLESDDGGNISITGEHGYSVFVTAVAKPGSQWISGGYADPSVYNFSYTPAFGDCYIPDKSRPAELLLWRKGASGEPVVSRGGSERLPDGSTRPGATIRLSKPQRI